MNFEAPNIQKGLFGFGCALGGWFHRCALLVLSLVAVFGLSWANGHALQPDNATQASRARFQGNTRFITIGHAYASIDTPQRRQQLIDRIIREEVDYVFVLGDSDAWQDDIASEYRSKIDAKMYFVPGNHDLEVDTLGEDRRSKYKDAIGYLNAVVIEHDINFILINSSEGIDRIKAFLKRSLAEINRDNVTVILAHHRIWDDNLISPAPYQHDKSFYFKDLLPTIGGKIDYILAGDSPFIYFGGSDRAKNENVVYWCDVVKSIVGCASGMRGPSASFLVVEVIGRELFISPRAYALRTPEVKNEKTLLVLYIEYFVGKVVRLLKHHHFWIGLLAGTIVFVGGYLIRLSFRQARQSGREES